MLLYCCYWQLLNTVATAVGGSRGRYNVLLVHISCCYIVGDTVSYANQPGSCTTQLVFLNNVVVSRTDLIELKVLYWILITTYQ